MMTVDNLPTQLPLDASEYFGAQLTPIIRRYIDSGLDDPLLQRASITVNGRVVNRFRSSLQPKIDSISGKTILIIGAGHVARPVINYLSQFQEYALIVAAPSFEHLEGFEVRGNVSLLQEEIREGRLGALEAAIERSDLVISLLPATMHKVLFPSLLRHRRPLITASYVSPEMQAIEPQLQASGITWLYEIGLDPGLDHMSAMRLIDRARSASHRVISFISWCGGLPAPEAADNPLGYKFSWSPRGVLLATQNPSRHLQDGRVVDIAGQELLKARKPLRLHPAFAFEGLPNRDALKYIELYGLEGIETMFRGTLRYTGFAEFLEAFGQLGFLNPTAPIKPYETWRDALKDAFGILTSQEPIDWVSVVKERFPEWTIDRVGRFLSGLSQLGLMSAPFDVTASPLDSLCAFLQRKLAFAKGERDLVYMHHELITVSPIGKRELHTSTLCQYGDGETAMSVTVGLPVAIAARLMLNGQVRLRPGIVIPTNRELYEPILAELDRFGVQFVEQNGELLSQARACSNWLE